MVRWRSPVFGLAMASLMAFLAGAAPTGAVAAPRASPDPAPAPSESSGTGIKIDTTASAQASGICPPGTPLKSYDVTAINVEITLNRWGDWIPEGKMYVLTADIARVRAKEASNRQARASSEASAGPELGLADDPIQPLTLRANLGECVEIRFTNQLNEPASMHIQGAAQVLKATGEAATAANPNAIAQPGTTVSYQWYVDPTANQEGARQIRPAANMRGLNDFGLFGALVVEPSGSRYLHDKTAQPLCRDLQAGVQTCNNDWRAMIDPGVGSDFREDVIYYHEFGTDTYQPRDRTGAPLSLISPLTGAYGTARFALNYRSEPHHDRLAAQQAATGGADESMAYSSYFFGDPATPIPRGYLGDPTKIRILHASGEAFHVHHLHGGGDRWPKQPTVPDPTAAFDSGLQKSFPNLPASVTLDTQTMGPSESYDTVPYCGAGGCQQGAGDYVFHCHVGHHYVSGMWSFWRVYNTLRTADDENASDDLGALAELPDRAGRIAQAVSSEALIGATVALGNSNVVVTQENLATVVERQLPPQGIPTGYDASVFDWVRNESTYLSEPDDTHVWANYRPDEPGERPPFMFDPHTGKLAYPFLRPHFLKRPPFAPGHGPAAFLDPSNDIDLPEPGANGPTSLCPTGTPRRFFNIVAENTPMQPTNGGETIDGLLYMLREERSAILGGQKKKEPLAIRANQGDCVDLTVVNHIPDTALGGFSKINIHQHFVQFDIQSTDGVVVGANFETSMRSYGDTGKALLAPAQAGDTSVTVADPTGLHPNTLVIVGIDQDETNEIVKISAINGNVLTLERPLRFAHQARELVSPEFVRQRWYLDMQFGPVYWHDHVKGLETWPRGLVGVLVVEPPDSTYHDPQTGAEVRSGTIADIHSAGPLLPDMSGSFREAVTMIFDEMEKTGTGVNLRSEPLEQRQLRIPGMDPAYLFSSVMNGDPVTMLPRAYAGDPVVFRLLTVSANRVNTFRLSGHTFSAEPYQPAEVDYRDAIPLGISDRESAYIRSAGGYTQKAGDYLWSLGDQHQVVDGAWGIFRVHDSLQPDLQPLPGRARPPEGAGFPYLTYTGTPPPAATAPGNACPASAPVRQFNVSAIRADLPLNKRTTIKGYMYVLDQDIAAVTSKKKPTEPLAIRINQGDCLVIRFTNRLEESRASLGVGKLSLDPQGSQGITVGYNPDQTVAPGQSITYRLYADHEMGTTLLRDYGNILENLRRGLYGALIVEPTGSAYLDPSTGAPLSSGNRAVITNPNLPDFREFVVQLHDEDPNISIHVMPYSDTVAGTVAINYRNEPLAARRKGTPDTARLFSSATHGDPATPLFQAVAGDPVTFRIAHGYGQQAQVFAVEGHTWTWMPSVNESMQLYARRIGTQGAANAPLVGGAGGPQRVPGDYLYLNQRLAYLEAGAWGLMRVYPTLPPGLIRLPDR